MPKKLFLCHCFSSSIRQPACDRTTVQHLWVSARSPWLWCANPDPRKCYYLETERHSLCNWGSILIEILCWQRKHQMWPLFWKSWWKQTHVLWSKSHLKMVHHPEGSFTSANFFIFRTEVSVQAFGAGLSQLLGCLRPISESQLYSAFQLPADVYLRRQQMMVQVLGSQPPIWETGIEFQAPGFRSAQPWLLQTFGESINGWKMSVFWCLPMSVSTPLSSRMKQQHRKQSAWVKWWHLTWVSVSLQGILTPSGREAYVSLKHFHIPGSQCEIWRQHPLFYFSHQPSKAVCIRFLKWEVVTQQFVSPVSNVKSDMVSATLSPLQFHPVRFRDACAF